MHILMHELYYIFLWAQVRPAVWRSDGHYSYSILRLYICIRNDEALYETKNQQISQAAGLLALHAG